MLSNRHNIYFFLFGVAPSQSLVAVWRKLRAIGGTNPILISTDRDSEKWLIESKITFLRWGDIANKFTSHKQRDGSSRDALLDPLFDNFVRHQACKNLKLIRPLFMDLWQHCELEMELAQYFWGRFEAAVTVHLDDIRSLDQSVIRQSEKYHKNSLVMQHGYHIPEKYTPWIRTGNIPIRLLSGMHDLACCA